MPKLKVLKGLRLAPPDLDALPAETAAELVDADGRAKSEIVGALYLEGDVVEPNAREAALLLRLFPDHFEKADAGA